MIPVCIQFIMCYAAISLVTDVCFSQALDATFIEDDRLSAQSIYRILKNGENQNIIVTSTGPFKVSVGRYENDTYTSLNLREEADTLINLSGDIYYDNDTIIMPGMSRASIISFYPGILTELRINVDAGFVEWRFREDLADGFYPGSTRVVSSVAGHIYSTRQRGSIPSTDTGQIALFRYDRGFTNRRVAIISTPPVYYRNVDGPDDVAGFPDGGAMSVVQVLDDSAASPRSIVVTHDSSLRQMAGYASISNPVVELPWYQNIEQMPTTDTVLIASTMYNKSNSKAFLRLTVISRQLEIIASRDYYREEKLVFFPAEVRRVAGRIYIAGYYKEYGESGELSDTSYSSAYIQVDTDGKLIKEVTVYDGSGYEYLSNIQISTDDNVIMGGTSDRGPFWIEVDPLAVSVENDEGEVAHFPNMTNMSISTLVKLYKGDVAIVIDILGRIIYSGIVDNIVDASRFGSYPLFVRLFDKDLFFIIRQ